MLFKQYFILLASLVATTIAAADCNNAIPKTTPDDAFTNQNNGTVTHNKTGLMWMRCLLGQTWDGSSCIGVGQTYTWQAALQISNGYGFAGYNDWRLPNKNELASIVEQACFSPAINIIAFPNTPASNVWPSSPSAYGSLGAWLVSFYNGQVSLNNKAYSFHVRLVRGGQ